MPALHQTVIELSGDPTKCSAALSRAADAVEAELVKRYPGVDGFALTTPDESATARQHGQVFREARKVRRGRLGVHVGLVAKDYRSVMLNTHQDAALSPAGIYAFMGLGTAGGAALLVSQRPDLPIGGLVFWSFVGLCFGGGVAIGIDRVLQPKLPPETLSSLHAELKAAVENALRG